ncbi:MAG: hypothetical protein GXO10_01320 [Crenarchaeota archaeon]|nr:hypothetical protein [Thermoproteota archaeon]
MGLLGLAANALIGGVALKALNDAYERRVNNFSNLYKNAKKRCKTRPDKQARELCMRQVMAKYYDKRAELEKEMLRELLKAKAPDKKIKMHQKRQLYFKSLSRVVKDKNVPLYKAPDEAKRQLGIYTIR